MSRHLLETLKIKISDYRSLINFIGSDRFSRIYDKLSEVQKKELDKSIVSKEEFRRVYIKLEQRVDPLEAKNCMELRKLASVYCIYNYSRMNKSELIAEIKRAKDAYRNN